MLARPVAEGSSADVCCALCQLLHELLPELAQTPLARLEPLLRDFLQVLQPQPGCRQDGAELVDGDSLLEWEERLLNEIQAARDEGDEEVHA
mmetsp:Transcript_1858/g.5611  ORF Transcript_1858/g.5611 Transcript_1858/m.5611 type:complete len:92 (+) Transcript_1858:212-487(+)